MSTLILYIESGTRAGETLTLTRASIVGRDGSSCDIHLPDGFISRNHALLSQVGAGWQLQDLGTVNGTVLDGVGLSGGQQGDLRDSGIVIFGGHDGVYCRYQAQAAAQSSRGRGQEAVRPPSHPGARPGMPHPPAGRGPERSHPGSPQRSQPGGRGPSVSRPGGRSPTGSVPGRSPTASVPGGRVPGAPRPGVAGARTRPGGSASGPTTSRSGAGDVRGRSTHDRPLVELASDPGARRPSPSLSSAEKKELDQLRQQSARLKAAKLDLQAEIVKLKESNRSLKGALDAARREVARLGHELGEAKRQGAAHGRASGVGSNPDVGHLIEQAQVFVQGFAQSLEAISSGLEYVDVPDRLASQLTEASLEIGDLRSLLNQAREMT